jgi:branched-chain amino acid transport system permease protein
VAAALLPNGLPLGIVVLGLVLGSLSGLTAMGLVLVYRSSRIINFAQAEIGGLAASVAVIMVVGYRLPYLVALPVGLAAALLTGALIDRVVVRRFFQAPRLILTVATVGLAQFLAGLEIQLPRLFDRVEPLTTFKTPWHVHFGIHPIIFNGDHLVAMIVIPLALAALAWFLGRSDIGVAVRGAAESGDRALLLGIPIRRLSTITWMVAAALSGLGAMLSAPILGPNLGALAGPEVLLAPLAAAVLARLESLPVALGASLGIGVLQQGVFWSYPRSSTVDLLLFALVLGALLFQRRSGARVDDSDIGDYEAVRQVRPVPQAMRGLLELRLAGLIGALLVGGVVLVLPLWFSRARLILVAFMAIYGIMAVSLVVLTGWAGQISLGQFAFAGVGAATTATLLVHAGIDLFVAFLASALVGSIAAVLIGLPALRIKGLLLAVTTLAFAVPVNTYFLNSAYFPRFTPRTVTRPPILQRFDINNPRTFYYFCVVILVVALALARNFRRSRVGRAVTAVRDNERGAAAYGINPVRAKLTAFVFSGALAGLAGGLYVLGVQGIGFSGFAPVNSLVVFTMVVVGGLGSLTGALAGAVYVQGVQYFFGGGARLLATGGGLVVLLMIVPGGLGEIAYVARDRFLRAVARRRGVDVPSLIREAEDDPDASAAADTTVDDAHALLKCVGLEASYGKLQVLFDANLAVAEGAIVALLGTNGAGKSTLLKVIAGLVPATSGRVLFDGVDVSTMSPIERLHHGIVMVPGGRGVFQSLTVAENLRLAGWLRRRDRGALADSTARVLDVFPALRDRLDEPASALSGGQQQMLTLAQALLCEPKLLMIDELSLGLAPRVVARLLDIVRDLNAAGTTIVLVEQSVNVATSIAQRAAFMDRGHVRFAGDLAELQAEPGLLRSVFLGARPAAVARRAPAKVAASGNGSRPSTDPPLRWRRRAQRRRPRHRGQPHRRPHRCQRRGEDHAA